MKKLIALTLVFCMLLPFATALPVFAQDKISVMLNGNALTFDVEPIILNGRTMVPMRAIFEALGASVYWNGESDTAMGVKNNKRVTVSIDDVNATVDGKLSVLDQAATLVDGRTLVPLRFVSEAFGCEVNWDGNTRTVTIKSDSLADGYFISANAFSEIGTWEMNGDYLQGRKTEVKIEDAKEGEVLDAVYTLNIPRGGKYNVWVNSNDNPTNQPGTRYFHAKVDGTMIDKKLGAHNINGFAWENIGTFEFEAGKHTFALCDTSGFYARSKGVFVCSDLNYVPANTIETLTKDYPVMDSFASVPAANYPAWAKKELAVTDTATIENDHVKVVFNKGTGARGAVVQNEIYIKVNDEWVKTKAANEEFGYLMMVADENTYISSPGGNTDAGPTLISQTLTLDGTQVKGSNTDFYKSGIPYWFIPESFEKVSDNEVKLTFPVKNDTTLTATFALDSFSEDPKVTLNATFGKEGSYSFMFFNGDGITEYDRVTAPFLYAKKKIPDYATMIGECYMYTPMATFTTTENGMKMTSGIVVDPTMSNQDFATADGSRYCCVLRTPDGKARGQFAAPQPGCGKSSFAAGETFTFSYRIVDRAEDWYDTYKYVAQDLYNDKDIRENYYTSINEAIYNITDLMLDDYVGGWDNKEMAWYNMEAPQVSSQSNMMEVYQRYLLTENEEMLEKRVVPSIAYSLTRKSMHFSRTDLQSGYTQGISPIMNSPQLYNTATYAGLYEMSQGRMPYLLSTAASRAGKSADYNGITTQNALYEATNRPEFIENINDLTNDYYEKTLKPGSDYMEKETITGGFVFSDHTYNLATFLAAYEITNDKKYLDLAEESGRLLATATWTTGYENGFDKNNYTVDPVKTEEMYPGFVEKAQANWFWHGKEKWRLGFPYGEYGWMQDSPIKLTEETVPGWVPAKTGLGTEHSNTASMNRAIYMNSWASLMMKLGMYTGDEFFTTQARNAMVGRFGNYAGYYQDRYVTHQQKADYPYNGPDYTLIYWHHIPVFASILEDYLISAVQATSKMKIKFPMIYQSGYAYFISGQYGHKPGTFYDEEDMWLWLDRGIVEPDNINADYIAARKDGKLAAAFINEKQEEITTIVSLGDKVPGGASYTGNATLYDENGTKSNINITNGKFTLTIPARGIRSVVIPVKDLKKPAYALDESLYNTDLNGTVASHKSGGAYAIQANDSNYFAYVYVTEHDLKDMTVKYTAGKQNGEVKITDGYPFETIIKVDNPKASFEYEVTVTKLDGTTESYGSATLTPLTGGPTQENISLLEPPEPADWGKTESIITTASGMGVGEGTLRIVVPVADFPFTVKNDNLVGCKVMGTLVDNTTGEQLILDTEIVMNELRYSSTVLSVKPTEAVPHKDYGLSHTTHLRIYPIGATDTKAPTLEDVEKAKELVNENPVAFGDRLSLDLKPSRIGAGTDHFRVVVWTADFPFEVWDDGLILFPGDLKVTNTKTKEVLVNTSGVIIDNSKSYSSTIVNFKPDDASIETQAYEGDEFKIELKLKPMKKDK